MVRQTRSDHNARIDYVRTETDINITVIYSSTTRNERPLFKSVVRKYTLTLKEGEIRYEPGRTKSSAKLAPFAPLVFDYVRTETDRNITVTYLYYVHQLNQVNNGKNRPGALVRCNIREKPHTNWR